MAVDASRDELELKARVADPVALSAALVRAGARLVFRGAMIDRRYDRDGELEARDEVLRLRVYIPAHGAPRTATDRESFRAHAVLSWKGPPSRRDAYRRREEWETPVADPEAARTVLERLRYAVSLRIDRAIEQYELNGAVVRLERYPAMDDLVEVEGPPDAIERATRATSIPRAEFLPESLPYFVAAYERRTGRRALLASEPG